MKKCIKIFAGTAALALCVSTAQASQLLFIPQNPDIFPGANPNNITALQGSGNLTRPVDPRTAGGPAQTPLAAAVRNAFVAQLSTNLYNQVFGSGAASSGVFNLGDGNLITFTRANGEITIVFSSPGSGSTTIVVPVQ